jgi:hypothetical protein
MTCYACERVKREGGYCSSHTPFIVGEGGSMTLVGTATFCEELLKRIEEANKEI